MTVPNYKELGFILLLGVMQPLIEISLGPRLAALYNVGAAVAVLGYVLFCVVKNPSIFKEWGLRFDNFRSTAPFYLIFTLVVAVFVYGYGVYLGTTPLPVSFWYLVALYPVWGIAQQFALQNFIARNLMALVPSLFLRALIVAGIFSLAHAPSVELMMVTALAGFVFTIIYHKLPNLFALGLSHGFLGALVFYLILGQDQWVIINDYVQ